MNSVKNLLILLIITVTLSCQKKFDDEVGEGIGNVTLNISADNLSEGNSSKLQASLKSNVTNVQKIYTSLGPELAIEATVEPESILNSSKKIAATTQTSSSKELENGTKIKIFVFDSKGNYFKSLTHTYKKGDNSIKIEKLNIGSTYQFIAYSTNSTSTVPVPKDTTNVSKLVLENLTTEFIYHHENITVRVGGNTVEMRLKHQFSEVYTTVEADQTDMRLGSKITELTNPTITGGFEKASFDLATGSPSFQNKLTSAKELKIIANTIGSDVIRSESLFILADGTGSTYDISSLKINGLFQHINIPDIKIQPGVRYNLKLKVVCPCVVDATPTGDFKVDIFGSNVASATPKPLTFTFPDSDFGAIIDIYQIDNSFNMTINDSTLYYGTQNNTNNPKQKTETNEIQFQGFNQYERSLKPNIQFADGTRWGKTYVDKNNKTVTMPEIFKMNGRSGSKPILKIQIDPQGHITMFGSKNDTGGEPYYPLSLINEQIKLGTETYDITGRFRKIKWNSGSNKIIVSQLPDYDTGIFGYITGKKIVDCRTLK